MPIYEYYCRHCSSKFEMLRPISSASEQATCPEGHPRAERVLSLVANYRGGGDDSWVDEGMPEMGGGCGCGAGGCGSC